jgi:hypothetical protein
MSYRKHYDEDMMIAAASAARRTQIVPDHCLIGRVTVTRWAAFDDAIANGLAVSVLATALGVVPGSDRWETVLMELPRLRLAWIKAMLLERWGALGWQQRRQGHIRQVSINLPDREARALYEMLLATHLDWRVELFVRE